MFRRYGMILILCVVICIASVIGMIKSCTDAHFGDLEQYLYDTLEISQASYRASMRDMQFLRESEDLLLSFTARFGTELIGGGSASYGQISELEQVMPECSFYYVSDDGEVMHGPTSENIAGIAEISRLAKRDVYRTGDKAFAAHALRDGALVVASRSMAVDFLKTHLNLGTSQIETIYWDTETGKQLFTSQPSASGLVRRDLNDSNVSAIELFVDTRIKIAYDRALGYFAHLERKIDRTTEITVYIALGDVIVGIIRSILSELILLPIVIIGMFYFFSVIPRNRGKKRVCPHVFINFDNMFHFSVFSLICALFALGGAFYLQLLSAQSVQTRVANDDLAVMASRIQKNEDTAREIEAAYALSVDRLFDLIAYGIKVRPELKESKALARIARELGVQEISVFDETGTVVASNTDLLGYVLSENPSAPESVFWDVIRGAEKKMTVYLSGKEDRAFIATARIDAPGMLRALYDANFHKMLMGSMTFETAFRTSGLLNGRKIYIENSEPRTLHYLPPDGEGIERHENVVDFDSPLEPFNGLKYVPNMGYFLVAALPIGDRVLVDAIPFSQIVLDVLDVMSFECFTIVLVYVILCFACSVSISIDDASDTQYVAYDDDTREYVQDKFRTTITRVMISTFVITLAIFALDSAFSQSSLFSYLMHSDGPSGVNLFSITNIILVMLIVWAIGRVLNTIIFMLVANLGVRATTIGHMLSSVIKFSELFFIIFYSLVQLGVSLSSLLTGAGIAGAGIAIAGQSVVTDLLSGLFIVFEGKFGVGDWVRLGDWRGQVVEIGVRTTSIAVGGDIKVVNNSQLGGVVVLAHRSSGAVAYFQIAYEEDIDKTIELLNSAPTRKEYRTEVPSISEGPICQGVTALADSGVTMRIWAYVDDQTESAATERAILRVTKRILDRNGITIPYPQIVVHEDKK